MIEHIKWQLDFYGAIGGGDRLDWMARPYNANALWFWAD
jgi:hypothetical protein